MNSDNLRELVRQKYAKAITTKTSCCGSLSCCSSGGNSATEIITGGLYSVNEMNGLPMEVVNASLGCGNPTALTELHPGETVLDLGSGAGLDVLLSARRIGPYGKAYGLDMTDEMLAEANANKAKVGATNVEFLKGHIEEIPLPDATVDVVISNCVINLSVDKDKVFREIYRVLKPGGRVAVSDIVTTKPLPEKIRLNLLAWAGCIAGALRGEEYKTKLSEVGFENIELEITRMYDLTAPSMQHLISGLTCEEYSNMNGALASSFIRAKKPAQELVLGKDYSIKLAGQEDFLQIHELLNTNGLPLAGVNSGNGKYYLAKGQELMGVIGVEYYGTASLLRSLAVKWNFRKVGLARNLIHQVLRELQDLGLHDVYLLTNTADQYLTRYGFSKIERDKVPSNVLATSALGNACPISSICMYMKL